MRTRLALIAVAAGALLAGCARPASHPTGQLSEGVPTSASPTAAAVTDRAAVFTAVLQRYLAKGSENSFGDVSHWPAVYVLDRSDPRAADPMSTHGAGEPISSADQQSITAALPDVPITFVHDGKDVIESPNGCARVRGGGMLITLGSPEPAGTDLHVGIEGFVACLGATWLTYVVSPTGGWHVTGTTGQFAIA